MAVNSSTFGAQERGGKYMKNNKYARVIMLALLAVFNIVAFALPIAHSTLFWAAYIITTFAIFLLGAFLMGLIPFKTATVAKPKQEFKVNKFYLNTLQVYVNVLNMKNKNEELGLELKDLSDIIQSSEPISSVSLEGIEEKIRLAFGNLQRLVEESRTAEAKETCEDIKEMLEERNRMCREIKNG
jgi:signal transduction histidine kinase